MKPKFFPSPSDVYAKAKLALCILREKAITLEATNRVAIMEMRKDSGKAVPATAAAGTIL